MKQIFLHLSNILSQLENQSGEKLIRWIDFDLAQLDQEKPPLSYPAALIQFGDANWIQFGSNEQMADQSITITFAFKVFERTHSKAIESYRDEALEHLDIIAAAHSAILEEQIPSNANFGTFTRTAQRNLTRADYRIYQTDYTVQVIDDTNSTRRKYTKPTPKPDLSINQNIVPPSINQNQNGTLFIDFNQSMNYNATLNLNGIIILNGTLYEV